jgi:hypothetical protein
MQNEGSGVRSDSGRTAIDHHAVIAAGQLLMSAIELEHRVRRFATHFSPRALVMPVVSSSVAQQFDSRPVGAGSSVGVPQPTRNPEEGMTL